jgi:hypothetical protein
VGGGVGEGLNRFSLKEVCSIHKGFPLIVVGKTKKRQSDL